MNLPAYEAHGSTWTITCESKLPTKVLVISNAVSNSHVEGHTIGQPSELIYDHGVCYGQKYQNECQEEIEVTTDHGITTIRIKHRHFVDEDKEVQEPLVGQRTFTLYDNNKILSKFTLSLDSYSIHRDSYQVTKLGNGDETPNCIYHVSNDPNHNFLINTDRYQIRPLSKYKIRFWYLMSAGVPNDLTIECRQHGLDRYKFSVDILKEFSLTPQPTWTLQESEVKTDANGHELHFLFKLNIRQNDCFTRDAWISDVEIISIPENEYRGP